MKRFTVYTNNNLKINKVAEFDTIEEARGFCVKMTEDCDLVLPGDNNWEARGNNFHCEVFDGEPIEVKEGDITDLKEPVYQTKQYYI